MSLQEVPRRNTGRNILLTVLFGCLGLALVISIVIGVFIYRGVRQVQQAMKQPGPPVSAATVKQQFAGIPIYPGAQLDLQATQTMAKVVGAMGKVLPIPGAGRAALSNMAFAVYKTTAAPAAIAAWYDREMASRGWVPGNAKSGRSFGSAQVQEQRTYQRQTTVLQVVAAQERKAPGSHLQLMLMRNPAAGSAAGQAAKAPGQSR